MQVLMTILLVAVPLGFGIFGGLLAVKRGRNRVLWGVLSAIFPIFILIVYFEKPLREVPGGFKKCGSCGEWIKWAESPCRFCATVQPPR